MTQNLIILRSQEYFECLAMYTSVFLFYEVPFHRLTYAPQIFCRFGIPQEFLFSRPKSVIYILSCDFSEKDSHQTNLEVNMYHDSILLDCVG